jgi:Ca-activated chloride channel family protein
MTRPPIAFIPLISLLAALSLLACDLAGTGDNVGGPRIVLSGGPTLGAAIPAPPNADVAGAAERYVPRERVTGPAEDLGTTVEVRQLPVPDVQRGSSAPFSFEDGRSGWVAELPEGNLLLTPAFADGKVFVGGGFASSTVYALDAETGSLEWRAAASDGGPSAAIIDEGRVFYNTESCTIFAVDAETGRPLWSVYLGDPMMAQPAADDGRVFTSHKDQSGPGHMFTALAGANGRILWQVPIPSDVISAPTLSDGRLFFTTMDGVVERRDPRTGRSLWRRRMRGVSAPWVDGEHIYLSRRVNAPAGARGPHEQQVILRAQDGRVESQGAVVAADHLRGAGRVRRILAQQNGAWESEASAAGAGNLGIRNIADGWAYQGARPTVIDGRSYAAVGDSIECRELESGRLLWRRRYAEDQGAQAMSPPAVVGSQMIVATVDGQVHAIDIDSGASLWAYDVGEPIAYQPSVARGWVYVGTATGKVVAFQAADESLDGWHMWGGNATHDGLVATVPVAAAPPTGSPASEAGWGGADGAPASSAPPGDAAGKGGEDDATSPASPAADDRPGEGVLRVVPPGREDAVGLPLEHTGVHMDVSGFVASVSVEQTFANPYEEPLEAIYHFPLPANAAVDAMLIRVGERTILGRIERRQRARLIYHAAREAGALAALLEQQRPDLFSQRVANVPPGGSVTVELHYVQILPYDQGAYEVRYPLVTERRAADPTADANDAGAPGEQSSLGSGADLAGLESAGFRRPRSVSLDIALDAGVPIEGVESPSHVVRVEERDPGVPAARSVVGWGGRRVHVELDEGGPVASRDFLLRYRVAGETPRAALLSHMDQRGGFFTLMLQPARDDAPAPATKRRVTIAIDSSSSMNGRPMEHARTVVETMLESLRDGDSFQIVSFSDLVRRHPEAPAAATDAAIIAAERWTSELRALGTTSMRAAVDAVLDLPAVSDDVLDLVVLVTDGYVAGDRELLREVEARLGNRRMVVLGVGTSVNRFLLERLAEVGRGTLRVIAPSEDPEIVAEAVVERLDRPQLTDVAIDWGDLAVYDVYPRRLPDLFAGQPLLVSGRFTVPGEANIRITGRQAGRAWTDQQTVVLDGFSEGNDAMAPVWARARVTDLMNVLWMEDDPDAEEAVTRLGLEFGLVTRFTSFIAVEDAFLRGLGSGGAGLGLSGTTSGGGGLGLSGTGMGGGGVGEGTIGLGNLGTIGHGEGGGVGYGYGGGMAMARGAPSVEPARRAFDAATPMEEMARAVGPTPGFGSSSGFGLRGRTASVPMVRAGMADIRGDLSREVIRRVIQANVNQVRACYEAALRTAPTLEGRVSVRFVIGPDGRVTASVVESSTLGDGRAERCVADVVHDLAFPAVPSGGVITVTYPFLFAPSEAVRPPPAVTLPPLRPEEDVIESLSEPRR